MNEMAEDEQIAWQAYQIYRGMKNPMTDPHWDDLSMSERGLLEWVVRYTKMLEQPSAGKRT